MSSHGWARKVARHPAIRPLAATVAGLAYSVRNRRRGVTERWRDATSWETAYWDDWLQNSEELPKLLDASRPVQESHIIPLLSHVPSETVDLLDVGAGPLTVIGKTWPGKAVRIVATDALANDYDRLLAKHGIDPPVRTIEAHGEQLLEVAAPASFDIAVCSNALDHCYDPVKVVNNMVAAVRPGGHVVLRHFVNEGESQHYLGMHQWNLDARDERFVVWNKSCQVDVSEQLTVRHAMRCEILQEDRKVLLVTIQRT